MSEQPRINLLFVGAPGAGKGTQAANIVEKYGLKHISCGDLLRAEVKAETDLGKEAKGYMEAGKLVPDDLIVRMMAGAVRADDAKNGVILDGWPRNANQALQLAEILRTDGEDLDAMISFEIPDEVLIKRITGRLFHPGSGRTYHDEFNPPKEPMKDDVTGEALIRRKDDNEETLKTRLSVFHEHTAPLAEYYKRQGSFYSVNAESSMEDVLAQLCKIIDVILLLKRQPATRLEVTRLQRKVDLLLDQQSSGSEKRAGSTPPLTEFTSAMTRIVSVHGVVSVACIGALILMSLKKTN